MAQTTPTDHGTDEDEGFGGPSVFAEINITPLTDVVFVLLIIFMVGSGAMIEAARHGELDVSLPRAGASSTPAQAPAEIVVALLRD
ncbi:MAG: biopolymer transporter ExbD, partial [Myxococcota bacterium]